MIFASPLFLFLFLPLTIVAYWTFPGCVRKAVLLAASLLFYAWGEARYVPLILGSICLNWWIGIRIADASRADARKRWAILGVAANLAVLALFKYANFAVANLNALAPILSVAPVSVATIKTRAMPKGDYGYFDAGKDYPSEARALGIEGAIRVRLIVDERGKVKSQMLLNRLGHGLDELALKRAAEIEFEPARDTDDRPVTSVVVWTFTMTLPK